ncbi:hypothetical protein LCGC14_1937910, partial [marine sediment metagenome]
MTKEPSLAYFGPGNPTTEEEALELVEANVRTYGHVAVDCETISIKDKTCIGVGYSCREHRVYLSVESDYFDRALELAANPHVLKIYHNAMFDLIVLHMVGQRYGVVLPDWHNIDDTSIMAQVQGLPANLAELTALTLAREIKEISDILPERSTMLDVAFEITAHKCADDIKATEDIYFKMGGPEWRDRTNPHDWQPIQSTQFGIDMSMPSNLHVSTRIKDCYEVDRVLLPILDRMGGRGVALRQDKLEAWYSKLSRERMAYRDACSKEGFNPGSPQQVGYMLAVRGNILPFTRSRKQLVTDNEHLRDLDDPLAHMVLAYRRMDKLLGTYIKPCLEMEAGRFFSYYRLDLATGRLASSDRNFQNIPPEVRNIFQPDSGIFSAADASQIEMRVWAHISQDPIMLRAFADGEDIHAVTQQALWPGSDPEDKAARRLAKNFNFAVIGDASAKTLSTDNHLPVKQCTEYKEAWLARYPVGAKYIRRRAEERGPWSETEFGRRMRLPDPVTRGEKHVSNCRQNYPLQGTAADIIKKAMLTVNKWVYEQAPGTVKLLMQVHDELVFEIKTECVEQYTTEICQLMSDAA